MENVAVIVAGGSGQRMKSSLPKQFMALHGRPILMHTLEQFAKAISNIRLILVLPNAQQSLWKSLCDEHNFHLAHEIVDGGETRFHSVKNGIDRCPSQGVVGVHDGVRPLISTTLIQHCYTETKVHGSALPVTALTQSLRKKTESGSQVINRDGMLAVQTPQCFDLSLIKDAFKTEYQPMFTDDATVFEHAGHHVHLVEGEESNLKITTPADLRIAEALMELANG